MLSVIEKKVNQNP